LLIFTYFINRLPICVLNDISLIRSLLIFVPSSPLLSSLLCQVAFSKNAQEFFSNDISCLFDATQRETSLKQPIIVSHFAKAKVAIEEVKRFLVAYSLEDSTRNLIDIIYMALILRSLHPDFDHVHVRDQILVGD